MPVRFRCVYCNKLLSIATRKAGTVINCPTCEKPLIVPTPEPGDEAQEEPAPSPQTSTRTTSSSPTAEQGKGNLFERDDFNQILNQGINDIQTQTQTKPQRPAPAVEPLPDVRTRAGTEVPIKLPAPPQPQPQTWLPPEPAQSPVVSDVELVSLTGLQVPVQKGIVLSPIKLILLFLFLIGVLSVIFVIGFYVGRATAPHQIISSAGTGG